MKNMINYNDLRNAFEFVSSGSPFQHSAYICINTGAIFWTSNVHELEEAAPEDVTNSDRYIAVPHKNDFKLGQHLALAFIDQALPHEYNFVANLFRRRGAFRRFKELLQSQDALEQWYAFEATASDAALLDWCNHNQIKLSPSE